MDRRLDKILDGYAVADADGAFLEGVMLCVRAQQDASSLRRRALLFAGLILSGMWIGNISADWTAMQDTVTSQYKYLTQATFGPVGLNDLLL